MIRQRNCIIIFFMFLFSFGIDAQIKRDSLVMQIQFKYGASPLEHNKKYMTKSDTLEIETVKFYLSNIEIEFDDKSKIKPKNNYYLIDWDNPKSFFIPIASRQNKIVSKVTFNIGVDSTASVSGALSGNLDPTNGMYWAWQSGYINMKIEGKSNSCKTRKNQFQFHLGGYLKPNYAIRKIEIPIQKNQIQNEAIKVIADLGNLFSEISLKETNSIMIPGKAAMEIADLSAKIFSVE
ncbi:MAG: hypothetical protein IPN80_07800 [Flavobacterium sp.]|nr:hypothetical protein [Flavobacterium sp.]